MSIHLNSMKASHGAGTGRRTRLARRRSGRSEKGLAFALALALTIAPAFASGPQDAIRGFYATLLATMKDGRDAWAKADATRALAPVVRQVFDVPLDGPARGRCRSWATLDADPAAAGDGRFRALHLGDLCRPVRPLFGRSR